VREEQLHDPGPVMDVAQGNVTDAQAQDIMAGALRVIPPGQLGRHQAASGQANIGIVVASLAHALRSIASLPSATRCLTSSPYRGSTSAAATKCHMRLI
jgi:hypothetical protein